MLKERGKLGTNALLSSTLSLNIRSEASGRSWIVRIVIVLLALVLIRIALVGGRTTGEQLKGTVATHVEGTLHKENKKAPERI